MAGPSPTMHRRSRGRRISLALCLLATAPSAVSFAPSARAESAAAILPADATLTRLIQESLAAIPELTGAQNLARAEAERVPQAGAMPDPMLQLGIQNDGFTSFEIGRMPTSYVSAMISQTFPWPGKLSHGEDAARLSAEQAKQAVVRARLSTEAEVRRAYLDLLVVRDRLVLLDQLEALWVKSLAVAQIRYEAGDGSQSDVLRAQLEKSRIGQRRLGLRAEERTRTANLNRLRNHPLSEPINTETHVRGLPAPATLESYFVSARVLAESPELSAARLGVARARESTLVAEKSSYPDLTVGAGIMYRGSLPPMWLVTVAGPLPVFSGSKQNRAAAESRVRATASQNEVAALEQVLLLRAAERHAVFKAILETIDVYEHGLLVQSEATTESTLSQYMVGRVGFVSVLEATAGLIGDQSSYLDAIAAAHRVLIDERELSLAPVSMPAVVGGSSGSMSSGNAPSMPTSSGAPASTTQGSRGGTNGGASTSSM